METLDLDIQNYDLEDILNVFHLNYGFNENDLKKAYKMVLRTHPDKSGYDAKVFIFFKQAYGVLSKIYYINTKKPSKTYNQQSTMTTQKRERIKLLKKLNGKSVKDFNKWFNDAFEKVKVFDDEQDTGYGDWYKTQNDTQKYNKVSSVSEFGREFEKQRQQCKSITLYNGLQEIGNTGGNGYNLDRTTAPTEYSSDIFSKLRYEDLKKAHTETVIPITREDLSNVRTASNINDLKQRRETQNTAPLSLQESKRFLEKKARMTNQQDTNRIYNIMKRDEKIAKRSEQWWSQYRPLENA